MSLKPPPTEADCALVRSLVIFEDEHIIALNKPAGLSSQGARGAILSLEDLLAAFARSNGKRPHLVHRLDRDTSGVILAAKTKPAAAFLGKRIAERKVKKSYLAIVAPGAPEPPKGEIALALRRVEQGREVFMSVCPDDHPAAGEDGVRLDRWFKRRWPHLNHIQIQKLVRSGQIRVDGARAKADTRLAAGQQVRVPPLPTAPPAEEKAKLSGRDIAYAHSLVLYEDDEVLALNKPSGLAVQGGTKTSKHIDRLLSAWGEGMDRPRLVHRLDRDTSGVLLLGRTPGAAAKLAGAFAKRRAEKTYWAIVVGNPKPAAGWIDMPLIKSGLNDRERVTPAEYNTPGADPAETEYVTLARAAHRAAFMALRPHTGRTHQLRAHMLAIGHPILGDPKYGDEASDQISEGLKLQLHARRISLPHPSAGRLVIEAPISPELRAGFERFGFDEHEADPEPFSTQPRRR